MSTVTVRKSENQKNKAMHDAPSATNGGQLQDQGTIPAGRPRLSNSSIWQCFASLLRNSNVSKPHQWNPQSKNISLWPPPSDTLQRESGMPAGRLLTLDKKIGGEKRCNSTNSTWSLTMQGWNLLFAGCPMSFLVPSWSLHLPYRRKLFSKFSFEFPSQQLFLRDRTHRFQSLE